MTVLFSAPQRPKLARVIAAVPLALCVTAAATAAEIRVFTSGAPAEVQKRLAVKFTHDTGRRVAFTVGNPAGIRQRLARGETPDMVVLPRPTIAALEQSGMLRPGVDLARVGIGVMVRAGARPPDISTEAAVRALLRDARSVVYPDPAGGGQTGVALARMTERLGMTATVAPKLILRQAIAGGVELVATGAVELGMFNISEVLAVKDVALVGPLPSELQSWLVFAAAIHAGNAAPAPAEAFIRFMTDPYARAQWRAGGLESLGGGS